MVAIALGIVVAVLDSAVANIALPAIARDLNATPAAAVWVVNAYQLATVASLLPLASLGERVGYRRVYLGGLAVFTLGSLACALSPQPPRSHRLAHRPGPRCRRHHEHERRARPGSPIR